MKKYTDLIVITFIALLFISCEMRANQSANQIQKQQTLSQSIQGSEITQNKVLETNIPLKEKIANLKVYQGWNELGFQLTEYMLYLGQNMIQMQQTNMQLLIQNSQMAGMMPDQNMLNQYQTNIQQGQQYVALANYIRLLCEEQRQLLYALNSDSKLLEDDALFAQATAFNALSLYCLFANQVQPAAFDQILPKAINWYFSPQSQSDINLSLSQLKQQHQINMAMANGHSLESGASLFSEDRHRERFSDYLLDKQTWIDTETGDRYKLPIEIENPTMNGYEMEAY